MSDKPIRSTAKRWAGAKNPDQEYRDRKRLKQPDGTYREFVGYGRTKRIATEALYARLREHEARNLTLDGVTVTQAMAALARRKRSMRGRKARTIHNDLYNYRTYVQASIGDRPIATVTLPDVEAVQLGITTRGKWRTAELVTVLLRSLWRDVERRYAREIRAGTVKLGVYRDEIEMPARPAEAVHVPSEPWTVEELEAFLADARATYRRAVSHLLYPVFYTAIAAGLRLGELLGLEQGDLEEVAGGHELVVRRQLPYYDGRHHRESPKSLAGARRVPIGLDLVGVLEEHRAKLVKVAKKNPRWEPNKLMFPGYHGRPLEPGHLYRAKSDIEERLKLTHSRLHDLRGVYATYVTRELVRQGRYSPVLVMRLLGQSRPDVALLHYNRVIREDLSTAVFSLNVGESVDKVVDIREKEKDAESVETAS